MKKLLFLLITLSLTYSAILQNKDKRLERLDIELNEVIFISPGDFKSPGEYSKY